MKKNFLTLSQKTDIIFCVADDATKRPWRVGWVVEGARLEIVLRLIAVLGFKSLTLRHQGTQILIQYLGLLFCIFSELWCKNQGVIRWNWCLKGNNCRILCFWSKYTIRVRTDSSQKRPLDYSRRLSWPRFCTPPDQKKRKAYTVLRYNPYTVYAFALEIWCSNYLW